MLDLSLFQPPFVLLLPPPSSLLPPPFLFLPPPFPLPPSSLSSLFQSRNLSHPTKPSLFPHIPHRSSKTKSQLLYSAWSTKPRNQPIQPHQMVRRWREGGGGEQWEGGRGSRKHRRKLRTGGDKRKVEEGRQTNIIIWRRTIGGMVGEEETDAAEGGGRVRQEVGVEQYMWFSYLKKWLIDGDYIF